MLYASKNSSSSLVNAIIEAIQRLRNAEPVAVPTETVYGLAASIDSESALRRIFELKQRPFFDPLIVHVAKIEDVARVAESLSDAERSLMERFWPGPLTLVLKRQKKLNPLITAASEYVAVRMPNHPVCLEVIRQLGSPIAAPSANLFGQVSPTCAAHVSKDLPNTFVIDGGPCAIGVESTVVQAFPSKKLLAVYRPGGLSVDDLRKWVFEFYPNWQVQQTASPVAPGQLKFHYQPSKAVLLTDQWPLPQEVFENFAQRTSIGKNPILLDLGDSPTLSARVLYQQLRSAAEQEIDLIVIVRKSSCTGDLWDAVWNRIEKAASFIYTQGQLQFKK